MIKTAAVSIVALAMAAATTAPFADSENRDLEGFDGVAVSGPMKVHVNVGDDYSVEAEGSERDLENLETIIKRDSLVIKFKKRYKPEGKVRVNVSMPSIDAGAISGSGDLNIVGASGEFKGAVSGSGDIEVSGSSFSTVKLAVSGSGDIKASGATCDSVKISISGSGDVNSHDLQCEDAKVAISGSGDVSLYASESFSGAIAGSGNIDVHGDPEERDLRKAGSGSARYK